MKKNVLMLIGVLVCLSCSACGSDDTGDTAKESQYIQEADEEDADVENEQEEDISEEEEQTDETIYNIGDSAELKDWEISVTDSKIVESIAASYGSYSPETEENRYLQIFVSVANNGKQADTFLPSYGFGDDVRAKVIYGEGYEFSATNLLGYSNEMHDSTVNPLSSKDGEIAFDIPEVVANSEEELLLQFTSGNDTVTFKIR